MIFCGQKQPSRHSIFRELAFLVFATATVIFVGGNDSRLGFSLVSFLRQAITLREKWMEGACVRGRLCDVPGHWGRNLIRDPPCAAELSERFEDFEQSFLDGQPFEFAEVAYELFAS